jgi:hypothetical protein
VCSVRLDLRSHIAKAFLGALSATRYKSILSDLDGQFSLSHRFNGYTTLWRGWEWKH